VPLAAGAAGDLDPSFEGDGKVITDLGGEVDFAEDVAIQRDGKIVVVGWSYNERTASSFLFVARYTPAGTLDSTFGGGGVVRTDAGGNASGSAVAIQDDGQIVAAGAGNDFMLARYNGDGRLDTSFDGDGVVFTDFGFGGGARGLTIQPDGKIVAVGSARSTAAQNSQEFAVARYNPDGSLDRGFDGDGRVMTPFTPLYDSAVDAAVQPDGKIVVGGFAGFSFPGPGSQRPDYALARYNADGSLDASFDGDGKTTSGGTCPGCFTGDLSLQAEGKILLAGGQVARYNRDGSLDSAFGQGGKASPDLHARAVLVQSDGKIVAAGSAEGDFAVARLLPNGRHDLGFGASGRAVTDLRGGSDGALSAALQRDRRIVLAGTAQVRTGSNQLFDVALVRYLNPAPPRCVVPNVRGKAVRAARGSIARGRCGVGRVKRKASKKVQKGRVISQTPRPGTALLVGGRVHLVISKGRRR
jgi:uncharacterized delta-60 repeat protein